MESAGTGKSAVWSLALSESAQCYSRGIAHRATQGHAISRQPPRSGCCEAAVHVHLSEVLKITEHLAWRQGRAESLHRRGRKMVFI